MSIMKLLQQAQGGQGLAQLAQQFGLDEGKAQELTQAAMKMGEQIYKQEQEAAPAGDAAEEAASEGDDDEDVVDAEFSEVDDEKKG